MRPRDRAASATPQAYTRSGLLCARASPPQTATPLTPPRSPDPPRKRTHRYRWKPGFARRLKPPRPLDTKRARIRRIEYRRTPHIRQRRTGPRGGGAPFLPVARRYPMVVWRTVLRWEDRLAGRWKWPSPWCASPPPSEGWCRNGRHPPLGGKLRHR